LVETAGAGPDGGIAAERWVFGYLPSNQSRLPIAAIELGAVTHVAHFAVRPNADGTLRYDRDLLAQAGALLSAAHAAGVVVLISVGGDDSAADGFSAAIADGARAALVANLASFVVAHGYDGVDLDMEPITAADEPNFAAFATDLRQRLDADRPPALLTAAAGRNLGPMYAGLASTFDQINLVAYNLSGLSSQARDAVTWHDSAMYAAGHHFADGRALPSCDQFVQEFLAAGVPRRKLGLGIYFHGKIWQGATGPDESSAGVTSVTDVAFADLEGSDFGAAGYVWDTGPDAPYLTDPAKDRFISFTDERLVAEKVGYVEAQGLGGVMIWDLAADYRPAEPPGKEQPLLEAIHLAR
jgi:chitinase